MTFEDIENIVSLLFTVVGLLYCLFKYIDTPKRGYRYLIAFFITSFLSEYYWTVYVLLMGESPNVSEFTAYIGWDVGYVFLLLAVFFLRRDGARGFFHPLILLPILSNLPQFILYIQYGGIINNLWMVGITTAAMIFCLQEILFCVKNRKEKKGFPWFSVIVLLYLVMQYVMWTSSCFEWDSELSNPYFYCSILVAVLRLFFGFGAGKHYEAEEGKAKKKSGSELRFQMLIQTILSLVIFGGCVGGYFIAAKIRNSLPGEYSALQDESSISLSLFIISVVLVFLLLAILYVSTAHYRSIRKNAKKIDEDRRVRINFLFTVIVTLALMVFAVAYNNLILYNASVVGVYEEGENKIKMTATELESYLTVAKTTLRVSADSVDLMVKDGSDISTIKKYIVDQTKIQSEQLDENFTGIYAYINGKYLDGLEWDPPADYDPKTRDWYKTAVKANGEVVIVSPYVDAQTGAVVITIAKEISRTRMFRNVVCLDVTLNHIAEIAEKVDITGRGYGMVVNSDGFIVAHHDVSNNGKNVDDVYGSELLDIIKNAKDGRAVAEVDGGESTLFVCPIMDQWYAVIVVGNAGLFEEVHSQLTVNIMVSLAIFILITFFYYIGYKNEGVSRKKVEEMNLQVVSALASAIDAKDNYTNGHSSRVAEYSRIIAERAGYSKADQDEIYMMGLLHDVGKIGVPDEVINKTSRLTDGEFELIKKHPSIGATILERIKERPKLAIGARWHHERFGGGGYPDGIAGEEIPEEARIIAVADAYDAMTSHRSYRDIMPQEKVRSEIEKGSGTQFDPRFAKIMLQLIDEDKEYSMRGN